jgi:DTW domain-containing protein YfiP
LLARFASIAASTASRDHDAAFGEDVPLAERHAMQVGNAVTSMLNKCRRYGACLACTLNPCICSQMPPLALSHRLWVVTHCKEVLRTTATGKLLLLAHPRATLLVSGLPAHDEELEQLCRQPTTAVLYPSPDALTPAALLERVARIPATASPASGASGSSASEQQPSSTGRVPPSPCLDIVLLDGTWNQVRQIFRTLPDAVPKVVISPKAGSERSVFGTAVRKQGKAREEAGRISTIEAYAQQRRST